jgi:hypothetical protein
MTDLNNKNTEEEIIKTEAMLISFVLNECGLDGSEILAARNAEGAAAELIEFMLNSLPEYVLDKLETVSSDAELRDALSVVIDEVNSLPCLTTAKAVFDKRMSDLAIKTEIYEMLFYFGFMGNEILLNNGLAQTAMKWAHDIVVHTDGNKKSTFQLLIDISKNETLDQEMAEKYV